MDELAVLNNVNAVELFSGKGLDDLLERISKEAKEVVPNTETVKGRKEIASMAAKVAKSKTYLDGLGKDLVSDWKKKSKVVDIERKKIRDRLDSLKEEVRKPLTDWEQAEEDRIHAHKERLEEITGAATYTSENWMELPLEAMRDRLGEIEKEKINESWDEYATITAQAKDAAVISIKESISKREKYDAEQAELEKLRKDKETRDKKEHEEKLRVEGEERIKRETQAKAKEDSERAEREKQAAIKAKEQAELRAKQAEENSAREAEQAATRERERIEQERIAEEVAAKKREADKKHRAKINNAAVDALIQSGLRTQWAKDAVIAIAKGQIPHVSISY